MSTQRTRWPFSAKAAREVQRRRRLRHATLLVGERDHLGLGFHARPCSRATRGIPPSIAARMGSVAHWDDADAQRIEAGPLRGSAQDLGDTAGSVEVGVDALAAGPRLPDHARARRGRRGGDHVRRRRRRLVVAGRRRRARSARATASCTAIDEDRRTRSSPATTGSTSRVRRARLARRDRAAAVGRRAHRGRRGSTRRRRRTRSSARPPSGASTCRELGAAARARGRARRTSRRVRPGAGGPTCSGATSAAPPGRSRTGLDPRRHRPGRRVAPAARAQRRGGALRRARRRRLRRARRRRASRCARARSSRGPRAPASRTRFARRRRRADAPGLRPARPARRVLLPALAQGVVPRASGCIFRVDDALDYWDGEE